MRFTLALIATLALLAAGVSTPQPFETGVALQIIKHSQLRNGDNAEKTANADALKSHLISVQAKIQRGLENYKKNTGSEHPSAVDHVGKRGASDPLTVYNSEVWYGSISVGTPPKLFTVDVDTGSSDLFLPSSSCHSHCEGHTLWDPRSSSTSKALDRTFRLEYADGSVASGDEYADNVSIAGYTATNQTLGAAKRYSSELAISQYPPDGLMGMAMQSISTFNASPVFQTLVREGQVTNPVFSFKLSNSSDSELFIGGVNPALYTGEFTYTSVTKEGFWQVKLDGIHSNGRTLLSNLDVVIDTGTTFILGVPKHVSSLYRTLGGVPAPKSYGDGFYTFPCNSFPTIDFRFGDTLFPISASALNLGRVSSKSSDCVSGIVGDKGSTSWTVGDVFLESVYSTFDLGKLRIGFARLT